MTVAPETSLLLHPLYQQVAEELGCLYINAGDFISLEETDGYHLAEKDHKILGEKVAEIIKHLVLRAWIRKVNMSEFDKGRLGKIKRSGHGRLMNDLWCVNDIKERF